MYNKEFMFGGFLGSNRAGPNIADLMEAGEGLLKLIDEDSFVSEFKSGTQRLKE